MDVMTAMMNGLIELVKQGGPLALWGITIWLIVGLVRSLVICLVLYFIVKLVVNCINNNYKISKEVSGQRVQLFSQEVSQRFQTSMDNFLKDSSAILKELETQLKDLKEKSTKK